jgi:hypothetical protein
MSAERTAAVSFCDDRVRVGAQHKKSRERTAKEREVGGERGGGGGSESPWNKASKHETCWKLLLI